MEGGYFLPMPRRSTKSTIVPRKHRGRRLCQHSAGEHVVTMATYGRPRGFGEHPQRPARKRLVADLDSLLRSSSRAAAVPPTPATTWTAAGDVDADHISCGTGCEGYCRGSPSSWS